MAGCSAAVAGMAGTRFGGFAFAGPNGDLNEEVLVVIFLRGGMDGLNAVMPRTGPDRGHYETGRPNLQIPTTGANASLSLGGGFGIHPAAGPLHDLYQDGHVAVIHATGLTVANRSHFDAMEYIERGTPGSRTTSTGWLARHLASASNLPPEIVMPALSVGNLQATSLLGDPDTINMSSTGSFNINNGPWYWRNAQRIALRNMYSSDNTWLHTSGMRAIDAMDVIELNGAGNYNPANGAVYPSGSFGDHLKVVAQMTKLGLGLRVATIDLGGWDTHNGQGSDGGGYFASLFGTLAEGIAALYTDLDGSGASNFTQRLTVVVQSEFGRRLRENDDEGTDHGHGNLMLVAGGNVNGGLHGQWPGLATHQLFDNADLDVRTDFRRVLSEILIRRMANNHLGIIFPGYTDYQPLGFVSGADMTPDYSGGGDMIFSNGFESGGVGAWG